MSRYMPVVLAVAILVVGCGGGGTEGTYVLDKEHMKQVVLDQAKKMMGGADLPPEAEKMAMEQVDKMKMTCELKSDGTYAVNGDMAGNIITNKGTYKVDGDKISFTTTEGDDKGQTISGTLKDGKITIKPNAEMPFDLILKKD